VALILAVHIIHIAQKIADVFSFAKFITNKLCNKLIVIKKCVVIESDPDFV